MNIKKERITVVEGMGRVYYYNIDVELEEVDFAVNLSKLEKQIGSKILNILEINELIDGYQIKIETQDQNGIVELEIDDDDDEKIIKKISNVEVRVKFRQGTIEVEGEGFYDCKRKKIILENRNSIRVEIFPLNSPGIMVYQTKNCFGVPEKLRIF